MMLRYKPCEFSIKTQCYFCFGIVFFYYLQLIKFIPQHY